MRQAEARGGAAALESRGTLSAAEVRQHEAEARGGVAALESRGPAHTRLTTLEGATLDVLHSADGVTATLADHRAERSDSLHGLLMRLSPGYGAFYLARVAAALLLRADDGEGEGEGEGGA